MTHSPTFDRFFQPLATHYAPLERLMILPRQLFVSHGSAVWHKADRVSKFTRERALPVDMITAPRQTDGILDDGVID